jgi:hypothetical protein
VFFLQGRRRGPACPVFFRAPSLHHACATQWQRGDMGVRSSSIFPRLLKCPPLTVSFFSRNDLLYEINLLLISFHKLIVLPGFCVTQLGLVSKNQKIITFSVVEDSVLKNCWQRILQNDKNYAIFEKVQPTFSSVLSEYDGKIILRWNFDTDLFNPIQIHIFY